MLVLTVESADRLCLRWRSSLVGVQFDQQRKEEFGYNRWRRSNDCCVARRESSVMKNCNGVSEY